MGVTTSSRFRQDAEFLLRHSNVQRLEQLMAKHAQRILDAKSNYNLLVRLCEEGHSEALVCAVELSRCVSVKCAEARSRIKVAGFVRPHVVATTFLYIQYILGLACLGAWFEDVDSYSQSICTSNTAGQWMRRMVFKLAATMLLTLMLPRAVYAPLICDARQSSCY